jgi:hypothetical protein
MISEYLLPDKVSTGGVQVSVHRLIQVLENVGVETTILAPYAPAAHECCVSHGSHRIVRGPCRASVRSKAGQYWLQLGLQ